LPETAIAKSDGFLVPTLLLITFLTTSKDVNEPGEGGFGVGVGHLLLTGEERSGQKHSRFSVPEPLGQGRGGTLSLRLPLLTLLLLLLMGPVVISDLVFFFAKTK
jgi:hypothetical protein